MCSKFSSFVKRFAPFALTFALGLFIASFFVQVSAPRFQFRGRFNRHREWDQQRERRITELEQENNRLQNRLNEIEKRDWVIEPNFDVPPPPPPKVNELPIMPMKSVPSRSR